MCLSYIIFLALKLLCHLEYLGLVNETKRNSLVAFLLFTLQILAYENLKQFIN